MIYEFVNKYYLLDATTIVRAIIFEMKGLVLEECSLLCKNFIRGYLLNLVREMNLFLIEHNVQISIDDLIHYNPLYIISDIKINNIINEEMIERT